MAKIMATVGVSSLSLGFALRAGVSSMEESQQIAASASLTIGAFGEDTARNFADVASSFGDVGNEFAFTSNEVARAFNIMVRESEGMIITTDDLRFAMALARAEEIGVAEASRIIAQFKRGETQAWENLIGPVRGYTTDLETTVDAGKDAIGITDKLKHQTALLGEGLGDLIGWLTGTTKETDDLAEATGSADDSVFDFSKTGLDFIEVMGGTTEAFGDWTDELEASLNFLKDVNDETKTASERFFDLTGKVRDTTSQWRDLNEITGDTPEIPPPYFDPTGGGIHVTSPNVESVFVPSLGAYVSQEAGRAMGLPGFAHGGVATEATAGIFGEAGPEALIPLDQFPGLMNGDGGGITIIVQGDVKDEGTVRALAREVERLITDNSRRGLGLRGFGVGAGVTG